MAGVGMKYMVAAPVQSHTDGNPITYGEGFEVGPSVAADITFNTNDNPDMGDDVVIDNDNGISGYSGSIENNFIEEAVAAKLYGWPLDSQSNEYAITSAASPEHGFGYIKDCLDRGVWKFRAFWASSLRWFPAACWLLCAAGCMRSCSTASRARRWASPRTSASPSFLSCVLPGWCCRSRA